MNQPLQADKMFERFHKNPDNQGSTGLGLAIVKAITDAYGVSITYSYSGRHIFTVSQ